MGLLKSTIFRAAAKRGERTFVKSPEHREILE
jgi:hypothetical protein